MKNDELKNKIVKILKEAMEPIEYGGDSEHAPEVHYPNEEEIADALILAGIGDVKTVREIGASAAAMAVFEAAKAEHRAEVAERALRDRATYCATYCVMEDMDYFSLTSVAIEARAKELYKSWRRKAEKELAEEEKDEQS